MGKSLIIKGADFSANAIPAPNSQLLSEMSLCFIPDKTMTNNGSTVELSTSETTTRAVVWDCDLAHYYNDGYRAIKITFKTDKSYIVGTGPSNNYVTFVSGNGTWTWATTETLTFSIASGDRLFIHLKNSDGGTIPATSVLTDFVSSVELS